MSGWTIELQPDGVFTVSNEVAHPLFSGAFPPPIPQSTRMAILGVVAEAASMLAVIRAVRDELDATIKELVTKNGEKEAMVLAPRLFQIRDALDAQIAAAEGRA